MLIYTRMIMMRDEGAPVAQTAYQQSEQSSLHLVRVSTPLGCPCNVHPCNEFQNHGIGHPSLS